MGFFNLNGQNEHGVSGNGRNGLPVKLRAMLFVVMALALVQLGMLAGQLLPGATAHADPIGMSVSGGTNPIVSVTGTLSSTTALTIYTVPTGKIFVITDIFANTGTYGQYDIFKLYNGTTGKYLWSGSWNYYSVSYPTVPAEAHFQTGIALPAGTLLQAHTYNGYNTFYTVTGYLARP